MTQTQTVIGIFDSPDEAHFARERLASHGIDPACLHIAAADQTQSSALSSTTGSTTDSPTSSATGGIRGFFSELFGSAHDEEATHYSQAVRPGGVVLAVDVPEGAPIDAVREALLEAGAVDIDERVEAGRQPPAAASATASQRSSVLPVIQEEMEVGKKQVRKGSVRVYSRLVETPVHETVTLREEHATIERRPVDRPASAADLEALGEKHIEIEEMAEKAVVSKSARVVEEVEVGKESSERTETIHDTLRSTEVKVDRDTAGGLGEAYDAHEATYRSDFQSRYAGQGGRFDDYAPAYRYGHTLASDPRYQGRGWTAIEPEVRSDWESRYPESSWERFKEAIRHAWASITGGD